MKLRAIWFAVAALVLGGCYTEFLVTEDAEEEYTDPVPPIVIVVPPPVIILEPIALPVGPVITQPSRPETPHRPDDVHKGGTDRPQSGSPAHGPRPAGPTRGGR